jgi:hypothetical protein
VFFLEISFKFTRELCFWGFEIQDKAMHVLFEWPRVWFSNDAACFAVPFWPAIHAAACTLDQQRQPVAKSP